MAYKVDLYNIRREDAGGGHISSLIKCQMIYIYNDKKIDDIIGVKLYVSIFVELLSRLVMLLKSLANELNRLIHT